MMKSSDASSSSKNGAKAVAPSKSSGSRHIQIAVPKELKKKCISSSTSQIHTVCIVSDSGEWNTPRFKARHAIRTQDICIVIEAVQLMEYLTLTFA